MKQLNSLRQEALICIGLVLLFIAIEAFITRMDFFFTHIDWIDHWLYYGHFNYGNEFLLNHVEDYKSSRLVWIWQGAFFFKHIAYPYSHYLFVIYNLLKFWFIFWLTARKYIINNPSNIFFYISIFIFYPTLRSNGGWYYHNFEASSWWLLAIYFFNSAQNASSQYKKIFAAGLCASLAINVNLFFINFLPIFILLSPKFFIKNKWALPFAILGLLVPIPLIGLANFLSNGPFEYYIPTLKQILVFNGASELWRPLLKAESFPLIVFLSVIAIYSIVKKAWKKEYAPLSISFVYTLVIYLFWHFRSIEVISVNIHNSFLLMMGFLMLIETTEENFRFNTNLVGISILWFFILWLIHINSSIIEISKTYLAYTDNYNIIMSLFLLLLFIPALIFKSRLVYLIMLAFIPYTFSHHRIYPHIIHNEMTCHGKSNYDVFFEIKKDMEKYSPMILTTPKDLSLGNIFNHIGQYEKWPQKSSFSDTCHFRELSSKDYTYRAIISDSTDAVLEASNCQEWNNYSKLITEKKYKICNEKNIYFSIWSEESKTTHRFDAQPIAKKISEH